MSHNVIDIKTKLRIWPTDCRKLFLVFVHPLAGSVVNILSTCCNISLIIKYNVCYLVKLCGI